ncbi:hypothetical protein [Mycobacteroides abscessus]|uniref:hypothetical protein n=1 Tax=Mycobacteroides abscessus TaxID=36809 RepID=UPI001C6AF14C|nr:hypothetical protein [Mycobacteroides abscessus]MDM2082853.1 hypothetical protein [Mycobacteroides abscessus]MDM2086027.1 hypothetical protein [Mycobacteroides abscessus]
MGLAPSQMTSTNSAVKPKLAATYEDSASVFSARGLKVVDRALKQGTVGGERGMRLLFEPAVLLAFGGPPTALYQVAAVARSIPFVGNYGIWSPAAETIALAYRTLRQTGDVRADEVERWLSIPENGGHDGPPVVHDAMRRRLQGHLLAHFNRVSYEPPLKLPQFSFAVAKLGELGTMWGFGGSETWPRTRIDDEIACVRIQVADFLA